MTGEITLRGRVLPVGGIKEKVLAAHRAGIRTVLLPAENEKDLEELPENVRDEMEFKLVRQMDEVLEMALHPVGGTRPAEQPSGAVEMTAKRSKPGGRRK